MPIENFFWHHMGKLLLLTVLITVVMIVSLVKTGPDWVSGGPFGAEGSVLAAAVMIVCCFWVYRKRNLLAPRTDTGFTRDINART